MRSSSAKIEANRKNAKRYTGPRTREGKAASSRNATRTGLATMTVTVMPGEDPADLEALQQSIRNEWTPQGDHENFLVDQMISARWRLERLARFEEEAMNKEIEGPARFMSNEAIRRFQAKSAHRRVLDEMNQTNTIFDKLERYTRAAERAYSKAARELQQLRANKARTAKHNEATEKQNKKKEAEAWLQAELAKLEERGIPDPMAGLWDREPNEATAEPLHPLPASAFPALE